MITALVVSAVFWFISTLLWFQMREIQRLHTQLEMERTRCEHFKSEGRISEAYNANLESEIARLLNEVELRNRTLLTIRRQRDMAITRLVFPKIEIHKN